MNFLKGSLFRRNTEPEELEPMEESGGGILAVWGSPGCGKTVTAVKIAKHLAAQKKNTVLLLCDMTAPMMPCICPPSELEVDKSLGSIFAAQHISVNLIKHNLTMVLHVSPRELSDNLFSCLTAAPGSIRADINETTKRKKAGYLRREITEAQAVLAASGRADRFPMVCFTSLLCFALGACIAIAAGNAFLVPVLAVGLMLTPFWYVKLTAGSFKKDVAAELETALSVITTAYLRTENFQQAVEENVRYLHPPVQEVFQHFLMRIKHIDPDMDAALTDLKAAIDNEVWREWCDAVMACQADRSLTSILTPIVSKLSDMRVVNAELENLVFGPRKEFITMAILVLINIPLVRFINKDWYHTLVATIPGQMVIAVCLAAVFVSFAFVVKLTQPIEYRR